MKKFFLIPFLAIGVMLSGCGSTTDSREPTYQDARNDPFVEVNKAAGNRLIKQLKEGATNYSLPEHSKLIIASFVDVHTLAPTNFGRIISEQVSAEFTKSSYRMQELKLRDSVGVIEGVGEELLSRNLTHLAQSYDAQAVILGSYATSQDFVYVNLKVIHPGSNTVLAVDDYTLPRNQNIRKMLRN